MRRFLPGKKVCLSVLGLLGLLLGLAVWNKSSLLSWHYVRQLASADESNREASVRRVVDLGEPCVAGLLQHMAAGSANARGNVAMALTGIAAQWGPDDARTESFFDAIKHTFSRCDEEGKSALLHVVLTIVEAQPAKEMLPASLAKWSVEMLAQAAGDEGLLLVNLRLAAGFLQRVPPGQGALLCRNLAHAGLKHADAPIRLAAVQVVLQPPFKNDAELLAKIVPLLKDSDASLRKAAILALAGARELISDDSLLSLLHDPDFEVRQVCELALRSRGLQDNHILLGRLISDRDPSARLLVLDHLHRSPDLEPGVWLQRLSTDPAAAVRAAAIRAAATQKQVDLRPRLHEMAREDPSLTVRQLAGFYLTRGLNRFAVD